MYILIIYYSSSIFHFPFTLSLILSPFFFLLYPLVLPIDSFYEWPVKGKGLRSRYFEGSETRYSFTTFTTDANEFMRPIHEKAMPVILNSKDEQRLWLMEGDEDLLRPYEGDMEFDQLPDTLEHFAP